MIDRLSLAFGLHHHHDFFALDRGVFKRNIMADRFSGAHGNRNVFRFVPDKRHRHFIRSNRDISN